MRHEGLEMRDKGRERRNEDEGGVVRGGEER